MRDQIFLFLTSYALVRHRFLFFAFCDAYWDISRLLLSFFYRKQAEPVRSLLKRPCCETNKGRPVPGPKVKTTVTPLMDTHTQTRTNRMEALCGRLNLLTLKPPEVRRKLLNSGGLPTPHQGNSPTTHMITLLTV